MTEWVTSLDGLPTGSIVRNRKGEVFVNCSAGPVDVTRWEKLNPEGYFGARVCEHGEFEILHRGKAPLPKVGQTIKPDQIGDLPDYTLVNLSATGTLRMVADGKTWSWDVARKGWHLSGPGWTAEYKVLYLPE